MRLLALALACAACSKGSGDKAAPVVVTHDAVAHDAAAVDEAVISLAWKPEDKRLVTEAGKALLEKSAGRCTTAKDSIVYTAYVEHDGATLIGIDCGERGNQMIGLVRHDGKTARVLAAAHIAAGSVRVDEILASPSRLCMQYHQIDRSRIVKNLRHCVPLAGDPEIPTVAPPPIPDAKLVEWSAPADILARVKARTFEEIQTCNNAREPGPQLTAAVEGGGRKWVAGSCEVLQDHVGGLALFEIRSQGPVLMTYSTDSSTDSIVIDGIRASDQLICVDYTRLPRDMKTELCSALY